MLTSGALFVSLFVIYLRSLRSGGGERSGRERSAAAWREDLGEKERRVLTCALFLTAAAAFGDDDGAEDHPRGAVDGIIAKIERYRMSIEPSSAISRRRLGSEVLRSQTAALKHRGIFA